MVHGAWASVGTRRLLVGVAMVTIAAMVSPVRGGASGGTPSTGPATHATSSASPFPADESWIVYQWYGLHLVRPDGSDDHVIAPEFGDLPGNDPWLEGAYNPDWSPDGSQIVFIDAVVEGWPIWVVDADGTGARELVPCGEGCQILDAPAWSPDGLSIAYARFEGEWPPELYTSRYSIEVMDLETGAQRSVVSFEAVPGEPAIMYEYPRWSPDGKSLVITVHKLDGVQTTHLASAIAIVDLTGPGLATPSIITDWEMWAAYPDWHPTDDVIVFNTRDLALFGGTDEPTDLYTIRPDGTALTQVTDFGVAGERATQASWTPDGERIIFTHVGQMAGWDNPRQIAFVDPDGSDLVVGFADHPVISATHPRLRPTP